MNWVTRLLRPGQSAERAPEQASAEELVRRGYAHEAEGDPARAEPLYRQALERDPAHADAPYLLGGLALADRRPEEAVALYRKAAELRPDEAIYLLAFGYALIGARHFEEAIPVYRSALALLPECIDARVNYTVPLIERGRREEARIELERVLPLVPRVSQVYFNLAGIYREYGRADDAIETYRRARALLPDHAPTHSNLLLETNYSARLDARAIFEEHQRFGERFARRYVAPVPDLSWPRRLRVGYLSPDFRNHVVMRFMEPILANHDHGDFEIFCYHTHPDSDSTTERLRGLASVWVHCHDLTETELAERIRADRIDLLVDLAGHTAGNRLTVLAAKPAPVQATYLGYPNTTGLGAVDYRITDALADPPGEADALSAEKLVRLPGCYFCYRPPAQTPPVSPSPADRSGVVTFGCFNNFAKLSEPFIEMTFELLRRVPGSRLFLKGRSLSIESVAASVSERYARAGIAPERLVLQGWVADPLAAYGKVDIALDSFPYNGATTTFESLYMGVPVITLTSDRHAGRVGSSVLGALGLQEFVAHSAEDFIVIAARLAGDAARRRELRGGLRETLSCSALMDEQGFTRRLEACYRELWEASRNADLALEGAADEGPAQMLARAGDLRAAGDLRGARVLCERLLGASPGLLDALTLLSDISFESGTPGAAADWLNRAIAANPGDAATHYMLGSVLQAQGKLNDAVAELQRALEIDARHARAHNNLGCILEAAGAVPAAAGHYEEAARLEPQMAQALYNLGNACKQLGHDERALETIERAIALEPGHADWLGNLGSLRHARRDWDGAIDAFEAAIALDPGSAQLQCGLASALMAAGEVDRAVAAVRRALELDPESWEAESWLLLARHYRDNESPRALFEGHLAWARRHAYGLPRSTAGPRRIDGRRLNIGYVAPPGHDGLRARLVEQVLARHDRKRFRVFCYATAGIHEDLRWRLENASDHWRDLSRAPDAGAFDRIRADGVDILVDLAGHSGGGRLQLFARKPAPTQVSWLGYPDTTGIEAIDFRLTDARAAPEEMEVLSTETLYRLPGGSILYVPPAECPDVAEAPCARVRHVTFGSCAEPTAISAQVLDLWCEILRAQPGARLVLRAPGFGAASVTRRVREHLRAGGIEASRVDLVDEDGDPATRLRGYAAIDVGLDAFPWNAMESTCDMLWMGVAVVSLAGRTTVSRIGASILGSAGLDNLVARTPREYVEIALRLASQLRELAVLRAGMRDRLRATAFADPARFTRSLEEAFLRMHRRDATKQSRADA